MSDKTSWIVVEAQTGYVDGFFGDEIGATLSMKTWSKRRPQYTHTVEPFDTSNVPDGFSIPSSIFLADVYHAMKPVGINREPMSLSAMIRRVSAKGTLTCQPS